MHSNVFRSNPSEKTNMVTCFTLCIGKTLLCKFCTSAWSTVFAYSVRKLHLPNCNIDIRMWYAVFQKNSLTSATKFVTFWVCTQTQWPLCNVYICSLQTICWNWTKRVKNEMWNEKRNFHKYAVILRFFMWLVYK